MQFMHEHVFASCEFSVEPQSAGHARKFIGSAYRRLGLPTLAAELLVSELVTNVLNHTTSRKVRITCFTSVQRRARIEVHDASCELPELRHADKYDENGRGIDLLDKLASWHVEKVPGGKIVCFTPKEDW
jgi:anti-sigma regulatory factor (Ser/Thr protein kinase)